MFVTKPSLVCAFSVIYECFIWNYVMNFQGVVGDFSSIKKGYNGRYAYGYKERNQLNYNKNGSYLPKL